MIHHFSVTRLVAASLFIFVTTADDAIWLCKLIAPGSAYPLWSRLIHAITFVVTLQIACIISWIIYFLLDKSLLDIIANQKNLVRIIGASITWLIAIVLLTKKMIKKYHIKNFNVKINNQITQDNKDYYYQSITQNEETLSLEQNKALNNEVISSDIEQRKLNKDENTDKVGSPQVITVIMLTLGGALDEIMCFPSLLMGDIFGIVELSISCFLASVSILIILYFLLNQCKPLLDLMDRIPLYVVVFFFAIIQTILIIFE
eukprot:gene9110-12287_t